MAPTVLVATAHGLRDVDGATIAFAGHEVTALTSTADGWLAVVDQHSVVSDDDRVRADVPGAAATCVASYADGALVGTDDAGLVRITGDRASPVAGFADADGRAAWYTPWGGPPSTRSLATDADGTPYVNVHVGGVLRSRDDGQSWQQTVDIDVDVHQVVTVGSGVVLAACGAGGVAVSRDGGDSWRFDTAGLHATYCRAVAVAGGTVLVTAALGPRGGRAAVYRRPLDSQDAFERCGVGLPTWFNGNIDTHRLATSGNAVAFASADGRVFVSEDAGASWLDAGRADGVKAVVVI